MRLSALTIFGQVVTRGPDSYQTADPAATEDYKKSRLLLSEGTVQGNGRVLYERGTDQTLRIPGGT